MSYSTPAFVSYGTWGPETRKNPAMKWMEDYTVNVIDKQQWSLPYSEYHADDFSVLKPDGNEVEGGEQAWAAIKELYSPFTEHLHEPFFLSCHETDYGWEMIGQAMVYANLQGKQAAGEQKVKDLTGKEWDIKVPGGFRFQYVKDAKAKNGGGIVLRMTQIMSDSGPAMMGMMKRGLIKASDLGL